MARNIGGCDWASSVRGRCLWLGWCMRLLLVHLLLLMCRVVLMVAVLLLSLLVLQLRLLVFCGLWGWDEAMRLVWSTLQANGIEAGRQIVHESIPML